MCGRYVLYEIDEIYEHFATEGFGELKPNYNAAPTHEMPVFSNAGLSIMRWGLIPVWAKDEKMSYKLFNTRSESVFEKPMWKGIVKRNRCLIPANGFYEWKKTDDGKIPQYIHLPDEKLFSFAGIWETWRHDGKEWHTYSIMTTTPNKEMEPIHDRMPVIIDKSDYDMWLNADTEDDINALLQPLTDGSLEMHEVSKDVNVVKNNSKELIGPLNSK
jgi:putative SOS response-associated peptidase YedK